MFLLLLAAVPGMGVLGVTPMFVLLVREIEWADYYIGHGFLFGCVDVFFISCLAGVFSMPAVLIGLARADLRIALPIVYGVSLVVVICYALTSELDSYLLDCVVPAFISVCVLSVLGRSVFPLARVAMAGMCSGCAYDLRGNTSGVCPECGAAIQGRRSK